MRNAVFSASLRRSAVAVALLAACAGWPFAARAAAGNAIVPRFEPVACAQFKLSSNDRCGFLVVRERHASNGAATVRLAVGIVPAVSKRPGSLPLVYLDGGPGGASLLSPGFLTGAGFNADRDLILVDQRGTYYSQPALTCPVLDRFFLRVLGLVYDADSTRREHVAAVRACRDRFLATGANLADFNTTESAQDFADLRRVLGYKQWNVYGVSYGTNLALTLMRADPGGIRSVVLDSTEPPNLVALPAFWTQARNGFYALMSPALRERFAALVRALEVRPAIANVPDPATGRSVTVNTDGGALANWLVGMSSVSPPRFDEVPAWLAQLSAGNSAAIASSRLSVITPPGLIGYGLTFGVICSEWYPFDRAAVLAEGRRVLPGYPDAVLEQAPQFTYLSDDCRVWNVPRAPALLREPVRSPIPTLLLSGSYDAITSTSWARAAAATLTNSRVVVFPGLGHGVVTASACARSVMRSFLLHPNAPDVRCVAGR